MGKGEIACSELFLFTTVFSKDLYRRYVKTMAFFRERANFCTLQQDFEQKQL